MRKTIRFIDMFAGIGGFREGFSRAGGFEGVGYCERDQYALRSYRTLFDTIGARIAAVDREVMAH